MLSDYGASHLVAVTRFVVFFILFELDLTVGCGLAHYLADLLSSFIFVETIDHSERLHLSLPGE